MLFHPVVERIPIVPELDPLWLILFLAAFIASAYATYRRPGYGAAILLFITPFAFPHALGGTTISLGKAALLGTLAGFCARTESRRQQAFPLPIAAAFLAIIAIDAGTIAFAQFRVEAIRESLKWCEYALVFVTVFVCYSADPRPQAVRAAWSLSLTIVALAALAELIAGAGSDLIVRGFALPRIAGPLEGPNQLGGYLEIAIAGLAAWQVRAPRRVTPWVLALGGVALALCFSRAALGCTVLALATIACFERARIARVWSIVAGALAGYVLVLISTPGLGIVPFFAAIAGERASDSYAAMSGGVGTRSELWRAALALARRHPWFGVGAGNYQYELGSVGLNGVRTQANNWYLQALAEGGIVLLAATIAWIVAVLAALRSRIAASPWALGALAASVAMIAHGFADDLMFYPKVAELWIALIALGCART